MLNRRISKGAIKKVLAGLLIFATVTFGFMYQHNKIQTLETDLYMKQQVEERATDMTITTYDKSSIELKFNEIQEYKIFNSQISVKHSYEFEEEAGFGFHRKATLTGNANVYFEYNVSLAAAEITETDNKIEITLDKCYLNKDTVHIVPNTFVRIDDECSNNIFTGHKTGEKVMNYWNLSLIDKSYEYIEDYYNDSAKVQSYAERQVKDLVNTITNKKVEVNFR